MRDCSNSRLWHGQSFSATGRAMKLQQMGAPSAARRGAALLALALLAAPLRAGSGDPRGLMPPAEPVIAGTGARPSPPAGGEGNCDALAGAARTGTALSVSAWVDLALCLNPDTRASWAGVRSAAAGVGIARAEELPAVSATIGGTGGGNKILDTPSASFQTSASGFAGLSIGWLVTDFGGRRARIAGAEAERAAALAGFAGVAQDLVLQTVIATNRVVAFEAAVEAARAQEAFSRASLSAAAEREKVGSGLKVDRLQAEAAQAEAQLQLRRTEANLKIARAQLAVAAGLDPETPARVSDWLAYRDPQLVSAAAADLIATAERLRPDLRVREAQREAALAGLERARAARRPSIALSANPAVRFDDSIPDSAGASVGLTLSVPVFQGFGLAYGIRRAEAERDRAAALFESTRQSVGLDVFASLENFEAELANLVTARRRLASAEEAADLALGRYRAGVGQIVDLLNAQASLAAARREQVSAEFEVRSRRVELARAIGRVEEVLP